MNELVLFISSRVTTTVVSVDIVTDGVTHTVTGPGCPGMAHRFPA